MIDGVEHRTFLPDDDALFFARKYPPFVRGDGVRGLRELLLPPMLARCARAAFRRSRPVANDPSLDTVLASGERRIFLGG